MTLAADVAGLREIDARGVVARRPLILHSLRFVLGLAGVGVTCDVAGGEGEMPAELLREIVRQGEVRLNATLALATAADLRATTLCGIFGTSAVSLEAGVLGYLASGHAFPPLVLAGTLAGACFFVAAALAAISGRPRDFYVAGGLPDDLRDWSWTGTGWRAAHEFLDATGQRYARLLRQNKRILASNSVLITCSLAMGLGSPLVGGLAYLAAVRVLW